MRLDIAPLLPDELPPARIVALADRGEVFVRHHRHSDPNRPTLLLLHGWTASADLQWVTSYATLAESFSFVALDHRGHGRGIRSGEPFRLEDAADDAAAVVRALGIERVIAVGYSMGGPIALLLHERHRDLVAGLVFEATALEWSSRRRDRMRWKLLIVAEVFMRSRLSEHLGGLALRRAGRRNSTLAPHLSWLAAELRRTDARSAIEAGRAIEVFDGRTMASAIDVPVGVLVTTRDRLVRPVKQRELAAATGGEVSELHGDHDCFWIDGERFAALTRSVALAVAAAGAPGRRRSERVLPTPAS